ncbi:hypothetical protein ACHAXN_002206 [Cyclotella atomus]
MKLSASLLLPLMLSGKGAVAHEGCDHTEESGYEVWRSLPPQDAKVKFAGVVDCDTETYTLTYSFVPDMNLPYINDITKTDWNGKIANPESTDVCLAEGMGPGLAENVPEGTHVGQNVHYTDYSYSYETSKKIQDATGFKLLTIGAGPCGTPTQPYPHYSVHFYTVDKSDREKMLCKSNGGYFCLPASEQCSESAMKFNLDGQGIEMCEDGSIANVPPGFRWTIDGNPAIGINAGSPGMGLHGLNPSDLGGYETPLYLMVNYDATIIANHFVLWGGLPLGQNNPGEDYHWTKEMPTYNCHNKEKYPSLPVKTSVDYVVAEGRTYISITGPTAKCTKSFTESWDSTKGSKAAKRAKGAKRA